MRTIIISLVLLSVPYLCFANTIHVPGDSTTIQGGIDGAESGDTVLVAPGVYTENIDFSGKSIKVITSDGREATTLQPADINNVIVKIVSGENSNTQFSGFTVIGGLAGQSIHISNSANPTISENILRDYLGTGVVIRITSNALISYNLFFDNGGHSCIAISGGTASIINNTFDNNARGFHTVTNHGIARNNIISNSYEYGIYGTFDELNYNDIWNNNPNYNGGASAGDNDISLDPKFADPENYDYTLQVTSPCIDAGDPSSPVPLGGGDRVDIGAFEYTYPQFSLIKPTNNDILFSPTPSFIWHALSDTTEYGTFEYYLYLDGVPDFTDCDSIATGIDTMVTLTEPLSKTGYWWWKVKGYNDTISLWSDETFSFRIDNLPLMPDVISPIDGSEITPPDWLIWTESYDGDKDDTVSYTAEIDNNPDFSNPEAIETGIMDFPEQPRKSSRKAIAGIQIQALQDFVNLKDDSLYYWRVKAVDKFGGESEFTDGSAFFILNLYNSPPLPPTDGFSPSGDIVINNLLPEISWYPGSDPDLSDNSSVLSYKIKIDKDGEFELDYIYQYITPQGVESIFLTDSLDDERQWFYVVQTIDDEGAESEWSEMQSFWTNWRNDAPEPFTLSYPPDTGWSQVYNFPETFWWAASNDPDPFDSVYYRLYVSIDSEFTFVAIYDSIYQTSFPVPSLDYGTHYWWKVIAIDTKGNETECDNVPDFLTWVLGDANADNSVNLGDAVFLINLVFNNGLAPDPLKIADVNGDCYVNLGDAVYLVNYVFNNGPEPLIGCDEPPE
jgi:parallel beta-helix repeat protein